MLTLSTKLLTRSTKAGELCLGGALSVAAIAGPQRHLRLVAAIQQFKRLAAEFTDLFGDGYAIEVHQDKQEDAGDAIVSYVLQGVLHSIPGLVDAVNRSIEGYKHNLNLGSQVVDSLESFDYCDGKGVFAELVGTVDFSYALDLDQAIAASRAESTGILPSLDPLLFAVERPLTFCTDGRDSLFEGQFEFERFDYIRSLLTRDAQACAYLAAAIERESANQVHSESIDSEDESDGPYGIYRWRHQGEVSSGEMTPKEWELAKVLYKRLGDFVYGDKLMGSGRLFANCQWSTIQKHGSNLSIWFADQRFPFEVTTGGNPPKIWMVRTNTE